MRDEARIFSFLACTLISASSPAQTDIHGIIHDPSGRPIAGASIQLRDPSGHITAHTVSDARGRFHLPEISAQSAQLLVDQPGFKPTSLQLPGSDPDLDVTLTPGSSQSINVTADLTQVDLFSPDPAVKVFASEDLIDANPGRPGVPLSIPGYPAETASGGIKAPQYFAPGVAGDHGEPIAQFIAVGGFLLPNNLSANAHGNGYADPNILIPATLSSVQVDGGAFNVLEGNHSVNLAATYALRPALSPFLTLTADYRDLDLTAAIAPTPTSWLALDVSIGNGFLHRLEHRRQYKLNAQRILEAGPHRLTLFGIAYYGQSFIPGLVPISPAPPQDTIDPRQHDQTHTALLAANDLWTLTPRQQLQFSGFFRTYNLALFSNFGDGLIRQSEFRTVSGGGANYANHLSDRLSLLAGLDLQREAPRRDDLDHYNFYSGSPSLGPFTKVTANDLTITPVTPYAAAQGTLGSHLHLYAGWRRDQIDFDNRDLVQPLNSFHQWVGVNSPKATIAITPGPAAFVPLVSASFGESFFTEDPRIGSGVAHGDLVSRAHSYQLVASKSIARTDFKLTLGHVTTSQQLAKIDPDTGLQQDQGPGSLRFLTATVRQSFSAGSLLLTLSKADARDLNSGQPTAEAPRTIFDLLGVATRLPLRLQARSEFEYVGAKPLGNGCAPNPLLQCIGVPVKEFRLALVRPFADDRLDLGLNLLAASGFSGQTLESFSSSPIPSITGVRIPSYASASFTYRFHPHPSTP